MGGFVEQEADDPHAFVQYKGTDICMDFYCECGAHCHFDGYFAYVVECPHCRQEWEMPCNIVPRKRGPLTYVGHVAKMLEPDEDYLDEAGHPSPLTPIVHLSSAAAQS